MGGPSRIRVFDLEGHTLPAPSLPPISAVYQLVPTAGGGALFSVSTYLEPSAWYRFDAATGKSARTALFRTSPVHFDDAEVVREFAVSNDGTRVPVNIIRRRGTRLDGNNPTLLEGYGGYGISMQPYFLGAFTRAWLDQGGVYRSPIFAEAGSMARNGIRQETSHANKTSSTISSPAPGT